MHSPSQLFLDFLEFRPHAVAPALPVDQEFAGAAFAADEGEAQEAEGLRLAEPALRALGHRKAAELDQAGLVRMERQRELPNRMRIAARKRRASASCSKPTTRSSA